MTLIELSRQLRELAHRPVTTRDELRQWEAAARELAASISGVRRIPHFVWHYLADADIRFRDDVYRFDQEQQLAAALQDLHEAERV